MTALVRESGEYGALFIVGHVIKMLTFTPTTLVGLAQPR
jgi:hypothetical protein